MTRPDGLSDEIRGYLPELLSDDTRRYWRRVLRMAALCHDIGHLPFSHAAEKELLPPGWNHERLTVELIRSPEMIEIWGRMNPPLRPEDLITVAVGPKELRDKEFSPWETLVAEIVVGDAFGVDRIDYLLRDSYHSGVAYGRFDHHRLIDTLQILPYSPSPSKVVAGEEAQDRSSRRPVLGIEHGGLQSAEALALARYFMYSQLYFHPVRRIYDLHLKEFLQEWLKGGRFPTRPKELLKITDNEVTAAMLDAAFDPKKRGHAAAKRLVTRDHFKVLYQRSPQDLKINPEAGEAIYRAAVEEFGADTILCDSYPQKGGAYDFPVLLHDQSVVSSTTLSKVLAEVPIVTIYTVFVAGSLLPRAKEWLSAHKDDIIRPREERE